MALTLSSIESFDPEAYVRAASYLSSTGEVWHDSYASAHRTIVESSFVGPAADALHAHTGREYSDAANHAQSLRDAAAQARSAAGDLRHMRQAILARIQEIQGERFVVREDLTVMPGFSRNQAEYRVRMLMATQHTAELTRRAAEMHARDAEAVTAITDRTSGLPVASDTIVGPRKTLAHGAGHDEFDLDTQYARPAGFTGGPAPLAATDYTPSSQACVIAVTLGGMQMWCMMSPTCASKAC